MFANSAGLPYGCKAFDRFWAEYCYLFMDGEWFMTNNGPWEEVTME